MLSQGSLTDAKNRPAACNGSPIMASRDLPTCSTQDVAVRVFNPFWGSTSPAPLLTGADYINHHPQWHSQGGAPRNSKSPEVTHADLGGGGVIFAVRSAIIYTTTKIGMCDLRTLAASWSPSLGLMYLGGGVNTELPDLDLPHRIGSCRRGQPPIR